MLALNYRIETPNALPSLAVSAGLMVLETPQSRLQLHIQYRTSVLHVEAKAMTTIKGRADTLRIILVIANGRSPKCSTAMKKRNQVDIETKFWIMVHTEVFKICRNESPRCSPKVFKPYLRTSTRMRV